MQMKTWSVALVLCLNIGVDPPDVVKTNPCARKECWIGEKTVEKHYKLLFGLPLCCRASVNESSESPGADR